MPSMEERNDEWGGGCCKDGGDCFECGECEDLDEIQINRNCPTCEGTGSYWDMPCMDCDGTGYWEW